MDSSSKLNAIGTITNVQCDNVQKLKYLKKQYEDYIRDGFLEVFQPYYCSIGMNIPYFNKIYKHCCTHNDCDPVMNKKYYELFMYVKNILLWVDAKLNYYPVVENSTPKINHRRMFKTSYIYDGQQEKRVCLYFRLPEYKTDSNEQTKQQYTKENVSLNNKISPPKLDCSNIKTLCDTDKSKTDLKTSLEKELTGSEIQETLNDFQEISTDFSGKDLTTSSNTDNFHSVSPVNTHSKQILKLEKSSKRLLRSSLIRKRNNSVTNSEHISKKTKLKPSTLTLENTSINDMNISLGPSYNSTSVLNASINTKDQAINEINNLKENDIHFSCTSDSSDNSIKKKKITERIECIEDNDNDNCTPKKKEKLNDVQKNSTDLSGKNECLITSNIDSCHSASPVNTQSKQILKLEKSSKRLLRSSLTGKRNNSVTNSEHISKKTKLKPSTLTLENTSINDMNISLGSSVKSTSVLNDNTNAKDQAVNEILINNLKEKDINFTRTSDNSIKKKKITKQTECVEDKEERTPKKEKEKLNDVQKSSTDLSGKNECLITSNIDSCHSVSPINTQSKQILKLERPSKRLLRSSLSGKRNNSVTNSEHISKKTKLKPSTLTLENTSINDMNISFGSSVNFTSVLNDNSNAKYQAVKEILVNNLKEKDINFTCTSDNSIKKKITDQTECVEGKEECTPKKKKAIQIITTPVDAQNNDFLVAEVLDSHSTTLPQLEQKRPIQKSEEKNNKTKKLFKNIYHRNYKGETKLHTACSKGNLNLVISLLFDGFNPNVKDNAGWTPLHEAVKMGHLQIVTELIFYGAFINVPGFEYESPLLTAIKYNEMDIARMLLNKGADIKCINMFGDNAHKILKQRRYLNEEHWLKLLNTNQIQCTSSKIIHNYISDEIVVFLNNVSLNNDLVKQFCKLYNIKLVHDIMSEKHFAHNNSSKVTHIIVPETKNNTCDVNMVNLIGIANGLFIIQQNWILDSLKQNKLLNYEDYEVSGTTYFADSNGPKMARVNKQNLYPKLFDDINVHLSGNIGWEQFSLEQLKRLIVEFGAKPLKRMPNPQDCSTTIIPYHCQNNERMYHVSNIILYTTDSDRLIKYNMEHLKVFHISWFMEVAQKHTII